MYPYIATPMFGGRCVEAYDVSMVELCVALTRVGIPYERQTLSGEAIVTRARNEIASRFLSTRCTCIMLIDADMGFRAVDAANQIRMASSGLDFTVGPYLKKVPPHEWTFRQFPPDRPQRFAGDRNARFLEIVQGGGGFMCLSRKVVETFARDATRYRGGTKDAPQVGYRIFQTAIDTSADPDMGEDVGEDFDLCTRWREKYGGQVWLNVDAQLVHVGDVAVAGKFDPDRKRDSARKPTAAPPAVEAPPAAPPATETPTDRPPRDEAAVPPLGELEAVPAPASPEALPARAEIGAMPAPPPPWAHLEKPGEVLGQQGVAPSSGATDGVAPGPSATDGVAHQGAAT